MLINYLENNICKFEELKPIDYTIKKNIISTSLFKMNTGGYKDFSKYLDGIIILSEIGYKYNLEIRIFIDNTIYTDIDIMKYLKSFNNITLILYKCNDFIINNHHVGLFGTLIRFFPLFNFKNNDSNIVYVADADVKKETLIDMINFHSILIKNDILEKMYIIYKGRYFNNNAIYNKKIIDNNNNTIYLPYCIAQRIIGICKISKRPLINFINKIKLYMDDLKRPNKILTDYYISDKEMITKCENNICFGIDEYFLNKILFKYLVRKNLPFWYNNTFDLSQYYYFKHPIFISKNIHNIKIPLNKYIILFNKYMQKIGLDQYSFNTIDKNIYIEDNNNSNKITTKFMEMYAKKMITLFHQMIKNKDYSIYNKYQFYSLKLVNYKKYFMKKYIYFINFDHKDIIIDYIKYSDNFSKSIKNI